MQVLPVFNFGSFICSLLCTWTDTKFPYRIFYCVNSPSFCGDFRKLRLKEINPACVWILEIKIKLIKTYVEKENKTTNLIRIHWKLKRCSTIYSQGTNISIFYHRHKMKLSEYHQSGLCFLRQMQEIISASFFAFYRIKLFQWAIIWR